jgi:hypothetical protein
MSVKLHVGREAVDLSLPEKLVLSALADSANDVALLLPSAHIPL